MSGNGMGFLQKHVCKTDKWSEENQREDFIQKCAWKFVRSARDRFKDGQGELKRNWAIEALKKQFPSWVGDGDPEDYIRAAYENYRIESQST